MPIVEETSGRCLKIARVVVPGEGEVETRQTRHFVCWSIRLEKRKEGDEDKQTSREEHLEQIATDEESPCGD